MNLRILLAAFCAGTAVLLAGCEIGGGGSSSPDDSGPPSAAGNWKGTWARASDGLTGDFALTLSQDGARLSGAYRDAGGWEGTVSGTFKESSRQVSFQIRYTNPAGRVENWQGTAVDNTLTALGGSWSCATDGSRGTWTAEKQ